ncbi:MAG: hypothetical protein QXN93_04480 [Methanomassiliicoccales archaeon]
MRYYSISILSALVVVSFLALPASYSVNAQGAEAPVWEEGDKWAIGSEIAYLPDLSEVESKLEPILNTANATLTEFSVISEAMFYSYWEVTEVTDTEYVLQAKVGAKVASDISVEIRAELPEEGTYQIYSDVFTWFASGFLGATKEMKTISIDFDEDFAIYSEGYLYLEKSTMAVERIDWELRSSSIVNFDATNIPSVNVEEKTFPLREVTINYSNYNVALRFDMNSDLEIEFDPHLDIFEFPFDVGDSWTVDSTATISGTIEGLIDINGLPEDAEEQIFTEEFIEKTGISHFPIEFDELQISEGDLSVHDGVIEPVEKTVNIDLKCIGKVGLSTSDAGQIQVYIIQVDNGAQYIYYSAERKFLAGTEFGFDAIDLPSEIPSGMIGDIEFEPLAVDPDTADEKLGEISQYQSAISDEATGKTGLDGLGGWAMILIIALVIGVVVVAAILLFIRKK